MDLRTGIILTVTGILALAHYLLTTRGISNLPRHLPPRAELIIAIVLIVLGVPLLIVAIARPR